MKYLLIINFLAVSGIASAQHDDLYYFKKQLEKQKQKNPSLPAQSQSPSLLPDQKSNLVLQEKQDYVLSDGNKVTILAQDNMPCIKPDMSQFNMPNAGTPEMLKRKPAIPNPGYREVPNPDLAFAPNKRIIKITVTDYRHLGKK